MENNEKCEKGSIVSSVLLKPEFHLYYIISNRDTSGLSYQRVKQHVASIDIRPMKQAGSFRNLQVAPLVQ